MTNLPQLSRNQKRDLAKFRPGKNRQILKRKQQEEFGPIQDDELGTKLFLHMYGTVEQPFFELDKGERKRARNEHLNQEKESLKEILKQEIGLFSKDTSIKESSQIQNNSPTFEIEWEEDQDTLSTEDNDSQNKKEKTPKKKERQINKLLKKIGVEEEEKKVEFEIDQ